VRLVHGWPAKNIEGVLRICMNVQSAEMLIDPASLFFMGTRRCIRLVYQILRVVQRSCVLEACVIETSSV